MAKCIPKSLHGSWGRLVAGIYLYRFFSATVVLSEKALVHVIKSSLQWSYDRAIHAPALKEAKRDPLSAHDHKTVPRIATILASVFLQYRPLLPKQENTETGLRPNGSLKIEITKCSMQDQCFPIPLVGTYVCC